MGPCSNCKYGVHNTKEGNVSCKRFPPTIVPMPGQDRMTGQMTMGIHSIFPVMALDDGCGEYAPRLKATGTDGH